MVSDFLFGTGMKTLCAVFASLPIFLSLGYETTDEYRTWTDNTGKYRVEAVLVADLPQEVKLRNRDGKEITVAKERLSPEDLAFLDSSTNRPSAKTASRDRRAKTSPDTSEESGDVNTEQSAIKSATESFFADLRTPDRTEATALLTEKARSLAEEGRSAIRHLPSPDDGAKAIRVGRPSIRKDTASVIVSVSVAKKQQKTMIAFKKEGQDWRVHSMSASRGDVEMTLDFESPLQPGEPKKESSNSLQGKSVELAGVTLDGRTVSLNDYRGKIVLVDFWATWCGPCLREMPNVYENYVKYHPQGFEVLAVSLDKDLMDLKRFLVEKNPPWVVLADEHPSNPQSMASKFGIRAIPTMLLIGKDGQVLDADCRGARLSAKLAEIFGG
jgi:thiol-disulfide isomerase/thioredoxin